jgi:hypothetical protein
MRRRSKDFQLFAGRNPGYHYKVRAIGAVAQGFAAAINSKWLDGATSRLR